MAALQIIALDTTTPQLRAPASGDTYAAPRALAMTPETLTGSAATSSLAITQTWNTTGTPTAIDLNVTDTASNAASLLMDLRVGGVTYAQISKFGIVSLPVVGGDTSGFIAGGTALANCRVYAGQYGLRVSSTSGVSWSSSTNLNSLDVNLVRDAANTLAQRNGTNAQALRVYGTFTDASNYERLSIGYSAGVSAFVIQREQAGTGAQRALYLNGGSQVFGVGAAPSGAYTWTIAASGGHLVAGVDNTYDIGASGANRPRDIYAAGKIDAGNGNLTLSNDVRLSRRSSGVLLLDNNGGTDFGRLQFGGTTSSFPALKRNGTTLETKLADDSGFAPHAAEWLSVTDGVTAPGAATGRARIYVDSADGDLKVVFADGTVKTIVTDT